MLIPEFKNACSNSCSSLETGVGGNDGVTLEVLLFKSKANASKSSSISWLGAGGFIGSAGRTGGTGPKS